MNNPATRALRAVGASLTTAALACAALALGAAPASAAPQVTVDAPGGIAMEGETTVTVSGTGFQSIRGGFGGIYVLFGTVTSDNWQPSKGGVTGKDYSYAADDETKPAGYESLVVFPGSATSYAATGGEISADGSWQSKLTIPGAKFTTYDRSGNASEVDCTTVQCGIITIGAHGQINANNESFTPVTFSSSAVGAPAGAAAQQTGPSAGADEEPQSSGASPAAPSPSAAPRAGGSGAGTAGSAGTPITIQTSSPDSEVRLSTIFLLVGVGLLGLALVVLAAGFGGFLAVKSIVLGLSPVAVERERARRQAKADRARARNEAKRRRYLAKHGLPESGDAPAWSAAPGGAFGAWPDEARAAEGRDGRDRPDGRDARDDDHCAADPAGQGAVQSPGASAPGGPDRVNGTGAPAQGAGDRADSAADAPGADSPDGAALAGPAADDTAVLETVGAAGPGGAGLNGFFSQAERQ
ncbi:MAG: hypothetical protein HXK03_01300 [Schaalia georgiae]|uniref:Minor silk ampullate protein n=1 Tax=Schaalia georgiae TaxID=52768 RepID=A0A929QXK9_9ACTO|nr:hypothetical protein [Schaalia georgiae]